MKLIDILAEELPKSGGWLRDVKTMTQDRGGNIWGYDCVSPCLKGGLWSSKSGDDLVRNSKIEARNLAVDWNTAIITREQYEAALAAKNEGWIEWGGGECPVLCGMMVDVKHRCGAVSENQQAWPKRHKESDVMVNPLSNAVQAFWRHENSVMDIIAYRLHQPQEVTEADDESELNECIGQDAAQVWGGEGKPAIGEKCEHHSGGQWEAVTIAGIYENLVTGFTDYLMVKEDGSSYTVGNPYRFRPIRSEAERKRDEAVAQLNNFVAMGKFALDEDLAYAVYDAIAAGKIPGVKLED